MLSIHYRPSILTTNCNSVDISHFLVSYSHTLGADNYYESAAIGIVCQINEAYDWLDRLMYHVDVYAKMGLKVFEGFVNQVTIAIGGKSITIGPLADIANRVTVKYSDIEVGQPARTVATNDTASQAIYGIVHKAISVGSVSSDTASNIQAVYLSENAYPTIDKSITNQPGEAVAVNIECCGYYRWLELYPYNESTDTTYTAREKVLEVIGDCPNAIFSSDYSLIEANSLSVNRKDNDDRVAATVIRDIVNMGGDSNNNRRIFGVKEDRTIFLQEIPDDVTYYSSQHGTLLTTFGDTVVQPYEVKAGVWLEDLDVPPNWNATSNRARLNRIFIEKVTYTAPYGLSINGGKIGTLSQQLAKLGLGSV